MPKKTKEQISYNMKRVKNKDSAIELILRKALWERGLRYRKNVTGIVGIPDIVFLNKKVAVFCDSEFWHGYNWEERKKDFKSNQEFWIPKIEKNMERDLEVNKELKKQGWTVLRFWGKEIKKNPGLCVDIIERAVKLKDKKFKTIDLCAGIGGIRRGFEMTGRFKNVLSAEIDTYACKTYEHIFGENPKNDITSEEFKNTAETLPYDTLLAGFPCQAFSRAGKKEGFFDATRGTLFFDIADIIKRTRPKSFLLENVDNLFTHDKGNTFKVILNLLIKELEYKIVGVTQDDNGNLIYDKSEFLRNSKNFGIPQNRPRVYIMGFDRKYYGKYTDSLPKKHLPTERPGEPIYKNLNDLLEFNAPAQYYVSQGYLETLKEHKIRHKNRGNGFGYIIVNQPETENPYSNAILATGGSGKERNMVYDPQEGIAGSVCRYKKSPLNSEGIRHMTPREWGKLQGFINYAFLDENGNDGFVLPEGLSNAQLYKQFGNSVTIPVIEQMALFMSECMSFMEMKLKKSTEV